MSGRSPREWVSLFRASMAGEVAGEVVVVVVGEVGVQCFQPHHLSVRSVVFVVYDCHQQVAVGEPSFPWPILRSPQNQHWSHPRPTHPLHHPTIAIGFDW